jgi:hypothetical protein
MAVGGERPDAGAVPAKGWLRVTAGRYAPHIAMTIVVALTMSAFVLRLSGFPLGVIVGIALMAYGFPNFSEYLNVKARVRQEAKFGEEAALLVTVRPTEKGVTIELRRNMNKIDRETAAEMLMFAAGTIRGGREGGYLRI